MDFEKTKEFKWVKLILAWQGTELMLVKTRE